MTAPKPQPCEQWRLKLAATHPADLEPAERAALEAHMAGCAACRAVYAAYARLDAAVDRLPGPAPLESLPPKLLALWTAEDRQRERQAAPGRAARTEPLRQQGSSAAAPAIPGRAAPRRPRRLASGLTALAAVLVIALLGAALLVSRLHSPSTPPAGGQTGTTPTSRVATPTPTAPPAAGGIPVTVYFSKFPLTTPTDVYAVQRYAPSRTGIEAFSIQLLIAGPTPGEQSQGYFSELNSLFSGPSAGCSANPTGGPDFTLTLNTKGTTPEQGTATLRFCRPTSSPGIGADGRVQAEVTKTLEQFPAIKKVVMLLQNGHCFGDESGADLCLR